MWRGKSVADACRVKQVDIEVLAKELDAAGSNDHGRVPAGVSRWSPEFLAQYIVNEHHTYVRSRMPVLLAFTEKVAKVHGHHYTELNTIRDTFAAMADELEMHMSMEETSVFPAIAKAGSQALTKQALQALESEHEAAGSAMASIRTLTNNYTPPEGACNTFRAAYAGLAEFEADLHAHVHLENNVLFPKLSDRVKEAA